MYCIVSFALTADLWLVFFFFKQKTAYEMRISDWSSDVCSSDLPAGADGRIGKIEVRVLRLGGVAEQLRERRHLEPGAVGAAEREPVDGLVLERVFRVGRAAEAVVAVVAAGDGHLQRIED